MLNARSRAHASVGRAPDTVRKGAYYAELLNGDIAWASSDAGNDVRDIAQAFDGQSVSPNWSSAFHGICHGVDYFKTPLVVRYSFQRALTDMRGGLPFRGAKGSVRTVTSIKLWQTASHHSTGRVVVSYRELSSGRVSPVVGASVSGFTSVKPGSLLTISFAAVRTDMVQVQIYAHENTKNPICVGFTEMEIHGCAG